MSASRVAVVCCVGGLILAGSVAVPAFRSLVPATLADVALYRVGRGDFVRRVHADGVLEAAEATLLGPPAETSIPLKIAWLAADGTRVAQGDVVIRFDPTDLERDLRDGHYDLQSAGSRITQRRARDEGNLRNLERDATMAEVEMDYASRFQSKDAQLFSRAEIIESEIDQDLAAKREAYARMSGDTHRELAADEQALLGIERHKAELKVEQARGQLTALEVRAPHDGIFVLKSMRGRDPEVGQTVWGGQAIAELPRLERMRARVYVLEADAGGLAVGLSARVELDGRPGQVHAARVVQVDALAQPRDDDVPVQYFGVLLDFDRTDPQVMKPGQRVQAVLTLEERTDVLTVPRQAVFEVRGHDVVYVRHGSRFEPAEVRVGPRGLGRVVIEEGLAGGEEIALRDPTRPADGPKPEAEAPRSAAVGSS